MPDQIFGQLFRGLGGEEAGMGIGQGGNLTLDRLDHAWMLVAKTAHRRAARCVQDFTPIGGGQPDAVAASGDRWRVPVQGAMDDAAFGHASDPVRCRDCAITGHPFKLRTESD